MGDLRQEGLAWPRLCSNLLRVSSSFQPRDVAELSRALADCSAVGRKAPALDLTALHRVVEYTPADMTVTVEAGLTLGALQAQLARHGQWLPIDPPHPAIPRHKTQHIACLTIGRDSKPAGRPES